MPNDVEYNDHFIDLTAGIVTAHVSNNSISAFDVPFFIKQVYSALVGLKISAGADPSSKTPDALIPKTPAGSIHTSVQPDHIVCLEDGKKVKMLRGHLRRVHGMTPHEYQVKWGLPEDYPMVAPNFSARRRSVAKQIGLGLHSRGGGRKPMR
jgi:predicted transcriptional regulator